MRVRKFEAEEETEYVLEKTPDVDGEEVGLGALEGVRVNRGEKVRGEVRDGEEEGDAQEVEEGEGVVVEVEVPVMEKKDD